MQWLHSVAALPPLQCQHTVKPGQSSAPSHHHHHHPAAPGGGSVLAGTASAKDTQCVDAAQPCFWNRCPNAGCAALQMGSVHILVQDGAESSATAQR